MFITRSRDQKVGGKAGLTRRTFMESITRGNPALCGSLQEGAWKKFSFLFNAILIAVDS
jgi:hypothetical protein